MIAVIIRTFSANIELIATAVKRYFAKSKTTFATSFLPSLFVMIKIIIFTMVCQSTAHAEPIKVNLLLGDTHSKTAIEAVKAIEKEYPEIKGKVEFNVYTSHSIKKGGVQDKALASSKVIFILLIMDRQAVEIIRPHIENAVRGHGRLQCPRWEE